MKRRLSAVLLALGLTVSALSMGVYAEETETTAAEQVTEAVTEAAAESKAEEMLEEAESEMESEAQETSTEAEAETEALSQEDQLKTSLSNDLTTIASWTDEQLETIINGSDASSASIAANWKSVKEELGGFVEITEIETSMEDTTLIYRANAKYEKVNDNTDVIVTYSADMETQTVSVTWDVDYPMGVLMQRAGMNTLMGIGIVFVTLLFLSFLISKLHIIPDMIEGRKKAEAPAPAPAPAAPVAEPAVVEEDLTDDLELVAVITAAIAASENTSSDGFVVRSIKKANKRNWQRA
ncbi:MAG: OadG family protein [Candidatus Choladocola sp.]|nr:OadG family protein [Candidatus Choladocola sp.]